MYHRITDFVRLSGSLGSLFFVAVRTASAYRKPVVVGSYGLGGKESMVIFMFRKEFANVKVTVSTRTKGDVNYGNI